MNRRFLATLAPALAMAPLTGPAVADVQPHAGMLRYPDVSAERIVFVYANDLWTVDREGGQAVPVASPPGAEGFARFSPDGKTVAFMGNFDGNLDLYTIPVAGGVPTRVTHHPAGEVLCDWTPDGDLLFYARGMQGYPRASQLFIVPADGGLPAPLPIPYGAAGAISGDGAWLAYTPHTRDQRTWKRYRGGMATDIWLFNLKTYVSRKVTEWEGTDTLPMWHAGVLHYLSDQGAAGRQNLWRFDPASGKHEQLTRFEEYDVKWPSIGPGPAGEGEIVFQYGAQLMLMDLASRKTREVKVTIPGARPSIRPQRVDMSENLQAAGISATGKRAVIQARGDVWTLPAENGAPRNLTRTAGVAERDPSWSPDGRWIAYFGDASGEYELYVTQSDGKGETRQLTSGHQTYFYNPVWSPDSKHIAFTDKAFTLYLHSLESEETRIIDRDPFGSRPTPSWSHDSRWITYARSGETSPITSVWVYNVEDDERHRLTSGVFPDGGPVFDRKGNYIFFTSSRHFAPSYSDLDTTFIYDETEVLLAAPLRDDVESPWLLESDEEEWDDEDAEDGADDEDAGDDDDADEDEASDDEDGDEDEAEDDAPKSPIHGTWAGMAKGFEALFAALGAPPAFDELEFTMSIIVAEDGTITGSSESQGESDAIDEITFDEDTGEFETRDAEDIGTVVMRGRLDGEKLSGTWEVPELGVTGTWEATKTSDEVDADAVDEDEAVEIVEIDVEGFERRAFQLPVDPGNFGQLAVNDKNQVLYTRFGDEMPSIKLFDLKDDEKEEKNVASNAAGYEISGDGKKILVLRPDASGAIQNASPGASGKPISTDGLWTMIDPRAEWRQIVREAWRLQRDFLYVDNMHGVNWDLVFEDYAAMLDDCVTREDVSYVIREMIAEINVGHAYYFGGDVEESPSMNVGMLAVDYELGDGAYRIARIYRGAPWDVDARNPLDEPGVDVEEGDYLLAVNGVPIDTSKDPWAAFVGTAGRTITLTVSDEPVLDENARDVVVKAIGSEGTRRYRAWIEEKRARVDAATDGQVGYIYVPNTGLDGQSDLVRQYVGQTQKKALIIDERWNGGGQIPTRFIEMLNRPITNYWARRDAKDWKWPPDAHHGPKCMLINGLAGSGGDMFPFLFRQAGLGKLIGTRTWGGLVGISGNPSLIDGGYTSVPTFGFYEKDGTWGIEGHGVEPDIEIVDDPALMLDGGDPQLDTAIDLMLSEIKANPYVPPARPAAPDRSGIGILEADK